AAGRSPGPWASTATMADATTQATPSCKSVGFMTAILLCQRDRCGAWYEKLVALTRLHFAYTTGRYEITRHRHDFAAVDAASGGRADDRRRTGHPAAPRRQSNAGDDPASV